MYDLCTITTSTVTVKGFLWRCTSEPGANQHRCQVTIKEEFAVGEKASDLTPEAGILLKNFSKKRSNFHSVCRPNPPPQNKRMVGFYLLYDLSPHIATSVPMR